MNGKIKVKVFFLVIFLSLFNFSYGATNYYKDDYLTKEIAKDIHPYTIDYKVKKGDLELILSIDTNFYSNGSFREVYQILDYEIRPINSNMRLENLDLSVWSFKGFPTTKISYGCSADLDLYIPRNTKRNELKRLKEDGFSYIGIKNNMKVFRKYIDVAGTVDIR